MGTELLQETNERKICHTTFFFPHRKHLSNELRQISKLRITIRICKVGFLFCKVDCFYERILSVKLFLYIL